MKRRDSTSFENRKGRKREKLLPLFSFVQNTESKTMRMAIEQMKILYAKGRHFYNIHMIQPHTDTCVYVLIEIIGGILTRVVVAHG